MNIKRLIKLSGVVIAIALITTVMYYFINTMPPDGFTEDDKAIAVFEDASCVACHQKNSEAPLYAGIPVIGRIINNRRQNGYRMFNVGDSFDHIKKGEAVNEVSLAKIEWVTLFNPSMPPATYYLTHWGAAINPAKRAIIRDWLHRHREQFYPAANPFRFEPVRPIPEAMEVDPAKITAGKTHFYDNRLSAEHAFSCASCHQPDRGGANNKQFALEAGKRLNTPTLYNATFNIAQGWIGHAANIHELIRDHHGYEQADEAVIDAIAEYTQSLLTPDCSFDRYLKGDDQAITPLAIYGYELFKSNKCAVCHAGITLGGQSFELMGIYANYFKDRGWETVKEDLGRYNVTADEADRHRFKVPGLRNVALTKPYFHDGSRQSLAEAVQIMGKYQSGKQISDNDVNAIVAFLETL